MFNRYRSAFGAPGAFAFSAASFLARFPMAVYPIGIVLIISGRTHAYGYAGLVSGTYVVGQAFGNPVAARLVDRHGQGRILPQFLAAHLVVAVWFGIEITLQTPLWTLLIPAALMGVTLLNIGALTRARWSYLWPEDAARRSTAYSVESTLDEVIFVLGPLVATVLATHSSPLVTLSLAALMIAGGTIWLARQRATEPPVPVRDPGVRHVSTLRQGGMQLVTWTMVLLGAVFGSAEVVMIAFCGQHGQRGNAGWVVACFAGGSAISGLFYGSRHWRAPLLQRFTISALTFGLLPLLFLAASSVPLVAVAAGLVGLGVAPILIGSFSLVESIVPTGSLTEGLTWIGSGLSVGYGIGTSVVGGIADRHGAHLAFLVPIGCAIGASVIVLVLAIRFRRVPQPAAR